MSNMRCLDLLHWVNTSELQHILGLLYRIRSRLLTVHKTTTNPDIMIIVEYNLKTITGMIADISGNDELITTTGAIDELGVINTNG